MVYYVLSNNSGYEGDLEIALVTTEFATEILGEKLDAKGVLVESADAETSEFALFFEFTGDKNKIRHVFHRCAVSRPNTESSTVEESKEVKTESLSLTASSLSTVWSRRSPVKRPMPLYTQTGSSSRICRICQALCR